MSLIMKQSTLIGLFSPKKVSSSANEKEASPIADSSVILSDTKKQISNSNEVISESKKSKSLSTKKPIKSKSSVDEGKQSKFEGGRIESKSNKEENCVKEMDKQTLSYEDFLGMEKKQTVKKLEKTNENEPKVRDQKPDLKVTEKSNNDVKETNKESLSYEDFLGMFKPASQEKTLDENPKIVNENEALEDKSDPLPAQVAAQCKTITSFFKKSASKTIASCALNTPSAITVIVDVHELSPTSTRIEDIDKSCLKKRERHAKKSDIKSINQDEIVLLSSEIVNVVEEKQHIETKKVSLKRKLENVNKNEDKEKKKLKTDTPLVGKPISLHSEKEQTDKSTMNKNCSQSTLSFGKSGFSLVKVNKPQGENSDTDKLKPEEVQEEQSELVILHDETKSKDEKSVRERSQRKRSAKMTMSPGVEVQESPKEDEPCEPLEHQAETSSSNTPLRRSSRARRSVQPFTEIEVMDIDSDDESKSIKKKINVKDAKKIQDDAVKSKTNSKKEPEKKVVGKLASIFTKVKPQEEEEEEDVEILDATPAEDPEKLRLKREFLMSGVPAELKRQIASTAANTVVADYPPIPIPNHVRQIDEAGLPKPSTPHKFPLKKDVGYHELDLPTKWNSFKVLSDSKYQQMSIVPFKNFTAHSDIPKEFVNIILADYQSADGKFPFRETYQYLESQVALGKLADKSTEPTCVSVNSLDDSVILVDEDSPKVETKNTLQDVSLEKNSLWSDLHSPQCSKQLVGNSRGLQQLKAWLMEWKIVMEREKEKEKKKKGKGNDKDKKRKDSKWSSDSDFRDSEYSEEEDLSLCNTTLITGPHGVGKTASVYALAQEMGFKVFEVSASSLRSGKQLLAQLEEATQSHRVSQSKTGTQQYASPAPGTKSDVTEIKSLKKDKPAKVKPQNGAFAKFFQPNVEKITIDKEKEARKLAKDKNKSDKAEKKAEKAKKSQEKSEEAAVDSAVLSSGVINLSSSSLILFDEVDIVFEDDKGFLTTVQHFMSSTKIPIILTARESSFHQQLAERHEHISFKRPQLTSVASLMCTVCLSHGVRVSHKSMVHLASLMRVDIRRCLLQLQYWCQSGGGISQMIVDLTSTPLKTPNVQRMLISASAHSDITHSTKKRSKAKRSLTRQDSSDSGDFTCLKPARVRRAIIQDDDASSTSSKSVASSVDCSAVTKKKRKHLRLKRERRATSKKNENDTEETSVSNKGSNSARRSARKGKMSTKTEQELCFRDNGMNTSLDAPTFPAVHLGFEEDVLGMWNCVASSNALLSLIKGPLPSLEWGTTVTRTMRSVLGSSAVYHLALHSLALPRTGAAKVQMSITQAKEETTDTTETQQPSWRRIMTGDWLESDSSNDGRDKKNVQSDSEQENVNNDKETKVTESTIKSESLNEKCNGINENDKQPSEETNHLKDNKKDSPKEPSNQAISTALKDFAKYYDSISACDILEISCPNWDKEYHEEASSLKTQTAECLLQGSKNEQSLWSAQYVDSIYLLSARCLAQCSEEGFQHSDQYLTMEESLSEEKPGIKTVLSSTVGEDSSQACISEQLHLPIGEKIPDIWGSEYKDSTSSQASVVKNVCANLGTCHTGSEPSLHTDYLPALRHMCRLETQRQDDNTKRRFHHYFDNISFGLKPSTVTELATTFTVTTAV